LQNRAGLQVRARNGQWLALTPLADTLVVNLGELLALVAAGACHAVPHRVCHAGGSEPRLSIPVFINPSLSAVIHPAAQMHDSSDDAHLAHVHRVIAPRQALTPFVFGASEWRRKGLGFWCYDAQCRTG
jgi:isopenicillin N synthase-like dioxygenase